MSSPFWAAGGYDAAAMAADARDKIRVTGPTLVALGAAGWGTEALFRRGLNARLAPYPIVLLEHLVQVVYTLPWLIKNAWLWRRIPRRALLWVVLSGGIGSSLGTVCFTAAMAKDSGVNVTAAVVLLNLQPIVSTLAGAILFEERISRRFYPCAATAILAGAGMAIGDGSWASLRTAHVTGGLLYVVATIVLWGFATAAGRGAMRELPLGLATPLRLWAGLLTTAIVLGLRVALHKDTFGFAALAEWSVLKNLLLLTSIAGVIPLFVYFAGLRTTPAAVAGYCEMCYTISASLVTWIFLDGSLNAHQILEAAILILSIVMLNEAQRPADRVALKKAA
jgi:drug/metabolite transporter, DME family